MPSPRDEKALGTRASQFNHFGKDNAYLLTFKAFLAIKAACNEANGNPLKGNFTAVEFDPAKACPDRRSLAGREPCLPAPSSPQPTRGRHLHVQHARGSALTVLLGLVQVEYNRDVIRRFMNDAEGYLDGSRTGKARV